jgi:integrase
MKPSRQLIALSPAPWCWPINRNVYDRTLTLSDVEQAELARCFGAWGALTEPQIRIRQTTRTILHRLLCPIHDVLTSLRVSPNTYWETVRVLCLEMHRRGTPFWAWEASEWGESICRSGASFAQRYGRTYDRPRSRPLLPVLAYLLCSPSPIDPLLEFIGIGPLARKIFGQEVIDATIEQLSSILKSWGYHQQHQTDFVACVCYLLLRNGSPLLSDLTGDLLETIRQTCPLPCVRKTLFQVSHALCALGILEQPTTDNRGRSTLVPKSTHEDIEEEWLTWCERWRAHTTQRASVGSYHVLLKVGRWLKVRHPEVTSPAQWTYALAAEFVAAVNEVKVGDWAAPHRRFRIPAAKLGAPLRPHTKAGILKVVRVFLRDCQEWGWIPIRFNPTRALHTPRPIRNLIGPDPRVVDKEFWAKILWAAMNLEVGDLPLGANDVAIYPLEMVRAIAMVWCFAALRSDEIWRLRVGCIRWQYEDVMVAGTQEMLPRDAVCFLAIPINKTTTAYTKAVHPLVGKRINEWEQLRPREQLHDLDSKTSEQVQFLFSYRGRRISKWYINNALIPLLCRKAGLPLEDSRGRITSHRARATIASMLYNAKEPLDIFQLKEYLGHKSLSSTQSYIRVDPTKLASKVAKTGYLEQNMATVEVLLDQEAVLSGAAARGETWKYYDLGHGYCTNTFWAACKHRMACARCPFYRPKQSTTEQLVEGKANLVRMLEFVKLTEDERLLVTEGVDLHQALIDRLADVPTPAGPTPRELAVEQQGDTKVIPLTSVRRSSKTKQDKQ